jgi:hypothetical protein
MNCKLVVFMVVEGYSGLVDVAPTRGVESCFGVD